jgi:hypothetical protein
MFWKRGGAYRVGDRGWHSDLALSRTRQGKGEGKVSAWNDDTKAGCSSKAGCDPPGINNLHCPVSCSKVYFRE